MALTIRVRSGSGGSTSPITFDAPRVVLGRGEGCEVRLPDPSISHRHASIRQRGNDYILVDEGSTNGTFVGPVRLSPQAPRIIRSGESIRVGRIWLEVQIEHVPATTNSPLATKELALALVAQALEADGEASAPCVYVVSGSDAGRELAMPLFERPYVIGRGKGCDLVLSDVDASRRHVELVRRGMRFEVRDLGSKNGSRLGELPLGSDRAVAWATGSSLVVGSNVLALRDPSLEALMELERAADELMDDGEAVPPPDANEAPADGARDASASPPPARAQPSFSGPPTARPGRSRATRHWTPLDVLVMLLALGVTLASLLGLAWLFRTQ